MTMQDDFSARLTSRFLRGLLSTDRGQAHLLNQIAEAESTDEGAIFERLLAYVDDPKLRQMITRHHDDELRHAELLRGCLAKTGIDPGPVPANLRLLDRIDAKCGGIMKEPVRNSNDVMISYLILLVIEERALSQFSQFISAFDRVNPETAAVFRSIARDEERHLLYCHAISRRYAPGEATWEANLHRFRKLESQAFAETTRANLAHTFAHGLHPASPLERFGWRTMQALAARTGTGPRTRFWGTSESPRMVEALA